tara:strand:- start:16165 stop:17166 length:1002 start_codon:yes stop_codon:yes gene_type:complete
MKILVTGNLGYIGSVLVGELKNLGHVVDGLDVGYFEDCILSNEIIVNKQIKKDVRTVSEEDITEYDTVIHLAALSNDPLGELKPTLTHEINFLASKRIAEICKKKLVKRFIFISTQSIYGISNSTSELDENKSVKNPITEYAKTKWLAEQEITKLGDNKFTVVSFRPSTVFGSSPRLRSDIVYNNLLGSAFTQNKIKIFSDGTPWRPVIHVLDLCNAIISGIDSPKELINKKSYNVGINNGNFTVKDLALNAQKLIPSSNLEFLNLNSSNDERTYRVSFSKIFNELKNYYKPKWDLNSGGSELIKFFEKVKFTFNDFDGDRTNRIKKLKKIFI